MEKMSLLLKKERLCLQGEGNNRKFCHSDAARLFFSFFNKGQKKTCYKMFFFVNGIFVCYRRNENLFVPFEIVYVQVNECTYACVYNLNIYVTS